MNREDSFSSGTSKDSNKTPPTKNSFKSNITKNNNDSNSNIHERIKEGGRGGGSSSGEFRFSDHAAPAGGDSDSVVVAIDDNDNNTHNNECGGGGDDGVDNLTSKANNNSSASSSAAAAKKKSSRSKNKKQHHNRSWASGNFSELFGWDQSTPPPGPPPSSPNNKPPLPSSKRDLEAEFHSKNRRFLIQAERDKMRMNAQNHSPQHPPNATALFARATSPSLSSKGRKRLESIGEEGNNNDMDEVDDDENDNETTPLQKRQFHHHVRINSDEFSALSTGSWLSRNTNDDSHGGGDSTTSSQLNKQELEQIAKFEKQQQDSFERAKKEIGHNLSKVLENRSTGILSEKDKDQFIRDYMDELEREREALVAQWKAELAAERERIGISGIDHHGDHSSYEYNNNNIYDNRQSSSSTHFTKTVYKTFVEPCLESIGSFLATTEVFLANLPLTIGAVGLSWVTMGTVWFKFMEEMSDFCIPTHYYEKQCTFPEFPGCFECDTDEPLYKIALHFHYFCSIFAGCCCVLFFLKFAIAYEVVIDELSNPTTSTPMGVVCIAVVCVFAGQGLIGESLVLIASVLHFVLAIWFLYMAVYKFGLWPDPGWFPSTVGISYAAVKTWLYFPTPGLIFLFFSVVFFFGIFFVSVVRVALNKKIAAPVTWIGLSAPSITLYGLTLVAQPTPITQDLFEDSEHVLLLHNHDWMIKHYMPFQHFMMVLSLVGLASALHGLISRWDGFSKKPFSPAHVAFCFPTLSHTNAVQAYRGAVNSFSNFPPGSPFKVGLYIYWVTFLLVGTVLNLVFTYMYIRRLPQWTKIDTAGEEEPPDPKHTFVHEMLDGTGAHELLDQPFTNPAVLQANEAGALVRVRRGTEDYRLHGPYIRTRKVTALGFDPTLDDEELRRERAELLDWVAKNAPRTRNRTMSNPLILSYLGKDGAPDEYGTFGGHHQHHHLHYGSSRRHKRSVTSSEIPGV